MQHSLKPLGKLDEYLEKFTQVHCRGCKVSDVEEQHNESGFRKRCAATLSEQGEWPSEDTWTTTLSFFQRTSVLFVGDSTLRNKAEALRLILSPGFPGGRACTLNLLEFPWELRCEGRGHE